MEFHFYIDITFSWIFIEELSLLSDKTHPDIIVANVVEATSGQHSPFDWFFNILPTNPSLRLFALQSSGVLDRNQSWLYSLPGSQTLTATFFVLTAISLPRLSISFVFMAAECWGVFRCFFMGAPAGHGSCKWWLFVSYNPIQLPFFPVNT